MPRKDSLSTITAISRNLERGTLPLDEERTHAFSCESQRLWFPKISEKGPRNSMKVHYTSISLPQMRGIILSLRTFKGHEEEEDDPWSQEGSDHNGKDDVPLHRDNNVVTLTLDLGGDDDRRSKI
jgi:hypothetical protein